jgi:hypothetical protein
MISPATQLEDLLRRAAAPGPHPPATDHQRAGLTVERAALLEACEVLLPAVLADAERLRASLLAHEQQDDNWPCECGHARCDHMRGRTSCTEDVGDTYCPCDVYRPAPTRHVPPHSDDALGTATSVPRREPDGCDGFADEAPGVFRDCSGTGWYRCRECGRYELPDGAVEVDRSSRVLLVRAAYGLLCVRKDGL